jgi:hypothetical protein
MNDTNHNRMRKELKGRREEKVIKLEIHEDFY